MNWAAKSDSLMVVLSAAVAFRLCKIRSGLLPARLTCGLRIMVVMFMLRVVERVFDYWLFHHNVAFSRLGDRWAAVDSSCTR